MTAGKLVFVTKERRANKTPEPTPWLIFDVRRISESNVITGRQLLREEIEQVRDMAERVIDHVYYLEKELSCSSHSINCSWLASPKKPEKYTLLPNDCFARGGWFYGLFDDAKLIGPAIFESNHVW